MLIFGGIPGTRALIHSSKLATYNMGKAYYLYTAILSLAASLAAQTGNEPVPEANPARPTVSTPATLVPYGYLQFETGSLGATTSPEFGTRVGINQVMADDLFPT